MDKWIRVIDHQASIMPKEDCKVWVTRTNCFREVWVQVIDYYVDSGRFEWDGVKAWMPYQEIKPEPYDCSKYFAGKPRMYKVIQCR